MDPDAHCSSGAAQDITRQVPPPPHHTPTRAVCAHQLPLLSAVCPRFIDTMESCFDRLPSHYLRFLSSIIHSALCFTLATLMEDIEGDDTRLPPASLTPCSSQSEFAAVSLESFESLRAARAAASKISVRLHPTCKMDTLAPPTDHGRRGAIIVSEHASATDATEPRRPTMVLKIVSPVRIFQ
jgi:hypothetical protein